MLEKNIRWPRRSTLEAGVHTMIFSRMRVVSRMGIVAALAIFVAAAASVAAQPSAGPGSANSIPKSNLVQPAELNQLLQASATSKPVVFQVGSRMLFEEAHIRGAIYAGPGADSSGLDLLRAQAGKLSHSASIVIYCGCCPWNRCPNIGPAFHLLRQMGFTHVKALYLADNFGTDWVNKGFPVAQ